MVGTNITPFFSVGSTNLVLLEPPIYSLNLGYDASDSGPTNGPTYTNWSEQGILDVYAAPVSTLTNLLLSYNPLTNLDVGSWPALQDLECWHCTNLTSVAVTNCTALERLCLESSDITGTLNINGDTNLAELRAASQGQRPGQTALLQNINFDSSSYNALWHLCAHDNPFTNNFDFTRFPSLRQFWFWNAHQGGPLILTNAPSLASVQVYDNDFTSADFHGAAYLGDLEIENNALSNLDLSGCGSASNVVVFAADSNDLPQAVVDAVLASCQQLEMQRHHPSSSIQLYGSAVPGVIGWTAINYLTNNPQRWGVQATLPPNGTPAITDVVSSPASNSATITWTTDIPSDSTVYYGTNTSYGSLTNLISLITNHYVILAGLTTNTDYHYYVASSNNGLTGISWDSQFTTTGPPAPPNTNPIVFVSSSQKITMQAVTSGNITLSWQWGDGNTDTNPTVTHNFTNAGPYINTLVVSPANSLIGFGVGCQTNSWTNTLNSVSGLTNYPNLEDLFLYMTETVDLSLAGCSNLIDVALAGTSPSTNTLNQWFNDLWAAEQAAPPTGSSTLCGDSPQWFYFPAFPATNSTSASACSNLVAHGWHLWHPN